jgi:pyrimidine/purine-5'-nucleotide nucleosidase
VRGMDAVREFRRRRSDSYNFNWLLSIRPEFQLPFEVTHQSMRSLNLGRDQPVHQLAANLRRAFSGVVTGNVKEYGIQAIERHGPYELAGERKLMELLDELLAAFVAQRRMRLPGSVYKPVYRLVA